MSSPYIVYTQHGETQAYADTALEAAEEIVLYNSNLWHPDAPTTVEVALEPNGPRRRFHVDVEVSVAGREVPCV